MPEPLDVFVLGAGASYVHGAPLTDQILPYVLGNDVLKKDRRAKTVATFLEAVFHCDTNSPAPRYPGLVDVLSTVDMALDRRENLSADYGEPELREVRRGLEYVIFRALQHALGRGGAQRHSNATRELVKRLDPHRTAIISFNYDVIIDIALASRMSPGTSFSSILAGQYAPLELPSIDYGVRFANVAPSRPDAFKLYKLHGSFNWIRSRSTGNLYFGGFEKAVGVLYDNRAGGARNLDAFFHEPIADLEPVMVTPTHLKDLRNVHLAMVWQNAEQALRRARRIVFIGYSLPGDDLHVKYLFKRSIQTRDRDAVPSLPQIVVVDRVGDAERQSGQVPVVRRRYEEFFGTHVDFLPDGFDAHVDELVQPT
jgi:hypothetical protein